MPSEVLTTGAFIGVIGVLLTIVATLISPLIWDRWINKPKLIIKPVERLGEKAPAIQQPALPQLIKKPTAFYHVNVKNKGRAPAKNLRPKLVFYKDDHKVCSFFPKWDFNPEPLTYRPKRREKPILIPEPSRYGPKRREAPELTRLILTPEPSKCRPIRRENLILIPEPSLMPQGALVDIPPHGEENFCILIKYEGEDECYGFSAFSYLRPDLKIREWKLDPGEYRVKLELIGDNVRKEVGLKIKCKRWVDVEKRRNIEEMFSDAVIINVEG